MKSCTRVQTLYPTYKRSWNIPGYILLPLTQMSIWLEADCLKWVYSGFVAEEGGEGAKEYRYSWLYLYMLTKLGLWRLSEQQCLPAWSFKGRSKLQSSLLSIAVLQRQRCCNWWEGEMAKSLARVQPALSSVKDKEFPQPSGFIKCQARVSH